MKGLLVPMVIMLVLAFIVTGCTSSTTPSSTTPVTSIPTSSTPVGSTATTSYPTSTTPLPSTQIPTSSTPSSAQYGGILIEAMASGPSGPFGSPWENSLSPTSTQTIIEEALLQEQSDGSLTPNLAISYDLNADPANPSITFHLRQGVKFQDGTDFNAQAVQWNLQMWKDGGMALGSTNYWKSIDVVDDYTVRVNFTEWKNYNIRIFGDAQGLQVSPTAYQKNGLEWMRTNPVSTAAFMQTNFTRDVVMDTVKNPNYWDKGKPYLNGIKQLYVADDMTRESLIKSGGADMIDCNNNDRLAAELKDAGFIILPQPASGYYSLVPDSANADSPWSKLDVRLAADYAIDKESLAKTFGYGYEQPAEQYYPAGSLAHDPSLTPRAYDPAKAKQLLTQAGYPNGFKTTMYVANNSPRDVAVAMQSQLAAVGIQCELQFPQPASMFAMWTGSGWHNGIFYMTQSLWANPNANWNLFAGEPANWFKTTKHPDGWKDALNASFATETPDVTLVKNLEKMLYDDETFISLSWHLGTFATTAKVHDTGYGTRGMWTWWNPENTWLSQ